MSVQKFQSEEPLRAQRMTADEAASVIALWQQEQTEQTGLTDQPAVPDVAEGLDITVEDVQRLLQAVRTRQAEEVRLLAQEQELAEAEMQLAKEQAKLTDIQRQRAEVQLPNTGKRKKGTPRWKNKIIEPIPWEVWKAAQASPPSELLQEVEAEWDIQQAANQTSPEPYNLKNLDESSVLKTVWACLIIVFFVLLICWKWGMA
jgi:hypothetical protein